MTSSLITLPRESLSLSEVLWVLSVGNYIAQLTFMAGTHIFVLNKVHAVEIHKRWPE